MRRDGVPRRLPGPEEFDTRATELEAAYELAWLACDTLADEVGEQALLDVLPPRLRRHPGGRCPASARPHPRGPRRAVAGPAGIVGVVTGWSERRTAATVAVAAGLAFTVLAVVLVPWDPVPGGAPAPVDPRSIFTPDELARAETYARWSRVWGWSGLVVSLAVAGALGFSRWGRRLVERLPGPWWAQAVLAVLVLGLLGRVATLPFSIATYRHRLDYGLTTQSAASFAADVVRNEVVGFVGTSIGVLALLAVARRWRRAWTAVAGLLMAALVVLASFVYPLVVEPVFNSFEPLPPGELRTEILRLADVEGVPVDEVLVADASRRTTTLNAYVSGFGGTRRVVVYDTLVESLPQDQALTVVAHELAHARHGDVVVGTALGALGAAAGVGLLGLLAGSRLNRGERGWERRRWCRSCWRRWRWGRCCRVRSRPGSAGRSRSAPTWTRWPPRKTRRRSSRCSARWRCGRSRIPRHRSGHSGGGEVIRRCWSAWRWRVLLTHPRKSGLFY